jgi:hypothetical protein
MRNANNIFKVTSNKMSQEVEIPKQVRERRYNNSMSSSPLKDQDKLLQTEKIQVNPSFHLKRTNINLGNSKERNYVSMNQS